MQRPNIKDVLREKILILDGAMGSLIQQYNLTDADYRGERFKNFPHEVKGNNDLLSITRPDVIKEIHAKYYNSNTDNMTVARLIESHRHLRNLNIEWNGAFREAQKEGYDFGYKNGLRDVQENTITLEDLRKMTLQEIANLIGTDD